MRNLSTEHFRAMNSSLRTDEPILILPGDFYQQSLGIAMESLVSVTLADVIMEDIEKRALSCLYTSPIIWKKYAGTAICSDYQLGEFLQHLNSIEHIQ